ncbi:hypothetical protein D3C76_1047510 [compost metagenome]
MPGLLDVIAVAVEPRLAHGSPVAETALPLHSITTGGFQVATDQVQLVAQQQAVAATLGQLMIKRRLIAAFRRRGKNRQLRIHQAVVQRHQPLRATGQAVAQRPWLLELFAPARTLGVGGVALEGVGEVEQLHLFIARQHHQGIAQVAPIEVDANGQGHIEKVLAKFLRQALRLAQHPQGPGLPSGFGPGTGCT